MALPCNTFSLHTAKCRAEDGICYAGLCGQVQVVLRHRLHEEREQHEKRARAGGVEEGGLAGAQGIGGVSEHAWQQDSQSFH